MTIPHRTAKDIEKLRAIRARDPRKRYILEPHERRHLQALAAKQKSLDRETVKKLADYFGVTMKPVVLALESYGMLNGGVQGRPSDEAKETRPKLRLAYKAVEVPKAPEKVEPPPAQNDAHKEDAAQMELLRVRLQVRENELRAREKALEQAERVAHNQKMEAELAIKAAEDRVAELEAEIEARQLPPRNPDAEPVTVYSEGIVRQMMLVGMRERDLEIERLRAVLARIGALATGEDRVELEPVEYVPPGLEVWG